jgi:hypothetical protein
MLDPNKVLRTRQPRHVGAIMQARRSALGASLLDLATADGVWATGEVAELELSARLPGRDVARYIQALERLGERA